MAQQLEHKCIICGMAYHHCDSCTRMKDFKPWRATADTSECFEAFLALREYEAGRMTKERFAEVLRDLDFDKKRVLPEVQAIFDEVLAEPVVQAESRRQDVPVRQSQNYHRKQKRR